MKSTWFLNSNKPRTKDRPLTMFIDQNSSRTGIAILEIFDDGTYSIEGLLACKRETFDNADSFRIGLEKELVSLVESFHITSVYYEQPYMNERLNFERIKKIVDMETVIKDLNYRYDIGVFIDCIHNTKWKNALFKHAGVTKRMPKGTKLHKEFCKKSIEVLHPELEKMVEDVYDALGIGIAHAVKLQFEKAKPKFRVKYWLSTEPEFEVAELIPNKSIEYNCFEGLTEKDTVTFNNPILFSDFGVYLITKGIQYDKHKEYYINAVKR